VGADRLHRVRRPPARIKLLRDLCVERRKWLDAREFEDAIAACNLLPGPVGGVQGRRAVLRNGQGS
jgi:Chromate transporter